MVDEKQDCVNCINACICSTLIVEGRIAHEFIHEIYENLYKNPHICNIIVYCSTEHELNTLQPIFQEKDYDVEIAYVLKNKDQHDEALRDQVELFRQAVYSGKFEKKIQD